MKRVFISYSQRDLEAAHRMYVDLTEAKYDAWFDQEKLLPGQVRQDKVEKAIRTSDFVLILLSLNSQNCRDTFYKEVRVAVSVLDTVPPGNHN